VIVMTAFDLKHARPSENGLLAVADQAGESGGVAGMVEKTLERRRRNEIDIELTRDNCGI